MTSAAAKGLADNESCQMTSRGRLICQPLIIHNDFLAASPVRKEGWAHEPGEDHRAASHTATTVLI
jgi:hypothetical protein